MAMPKPGAGHGRGVVDAVADHGHLAVPLDQRARPPRPCPRAAARRAPRRCRPRARWPRRWLRLSPVSMTRCSMPAARSACSVSAALGRTVSAIASRPQTCRSLPMATTVLPVALQRLRPCRGLRVLLAALEQIAVRAEPERPRPRSVPVTPAPLQHLHSAAGAGSMPRAAAQPRTARASGWVLRASSAAARSSSCSSVWPLSGITSTTAGSPQVRVPVLSKASAPQPGRPLDEDAALDQHALAGGGGQRGDDAHRASRSPARRDRR